MANDSSPSNPPGSASAPARILIVDDDEQLLQGLSALLALRLRGASVETCSRAEPALERIAATDYDAIVSDIKMPGMDGFALMEKVLELRPTTPTLLITGYADHEVGVRAINSGAYAFIQKPIDRDFFVGWLKNAIQLRHLTRVVEQQNLKLKELVNERTAELERKSKELHNTLGRLRNSEHELNDLFENAPVPLHWVGPDGIILRANQAELDLLGYSRDEYVGQHIAEFHVDQPVVDDILSLLSRGETLHDYEARLRSKKGEIKVVLISASVFWKDGEFIHARCFTRDNTDLKRVDEPLTEIHQR